MEKHCAVKENLYTIFKTEEKTREYIKEHPDYHYQYFREWRYYNNQDLGVNRFAIIRGDDLITAIEADFPQINKNSGINGASGYTLESVSLESRPDGKVILTIRAYPFTTGVVGYGKDPRYIFNAENLRTKEIEILDVTPEEFTAGKHEFEIND